jgi:chaperonin GroEL
MGAKLIIDASERSNEECGDGTTTASLVAGYIMSEGSKLLTSSTSLNPVELRKGIQSAVEIICQELDKMATQITSVEDQMIKNVSLVSSNGDEEISQLIWDIHKRIGSDGTISIQEG